MDLSSVRLRSRLLRDGLTDADLRRMRRAGALSPLRRGAYRPTGAGGEKVDPEAAHALLVEATVAQLGRGWVVSHESAAIMLGLPVWNRPLGRVHLIRPGTGGGRVTAQVHRHHAPLDPADVVMVSGVPVTGPARTVVDVACRAPFEQAVVIADAALAPQPDGAPLTDAATLRAEALRCGRTGCGAARRVAAFADGGAHSPGESRSRVALWVAGLPVPLLQYPVYDDDGRLLGRVDFGWPERGVVGEFDGQVKYGRLLRRGETAADAVYREKRREDAVRATDLSMVRWAWPDLDDFAPTARRIRGRLGPTAHLASVRAWPDMRG